MTTARRLPSIEPGQEVAWVRSHLMDLCRDEPAHSARFTGTQVAADAALASFSVSGYASRRNEVLPISRRGASGLSPWIRHGLLPLPTVWNSVTGPYRDMEKFRDELDWQEYARHLYARIGSENSHAIRYEPYQAETHSPHLPGPWDRSMHCIDSVLTELESDGWMVNQTRMWLASQWSVRHGAEWTVGEDAFFAHLLDGSRAANRLGWQWTIGAGTGKPYGFSRWQVTKRAPELCRSCPHQHQCPIERWPAERSLHRTPEPDGLRSITDGATVAGPGSPKIIGEPTAVWITAESLGDDDPALRSHENLPVFFVFDEPLLRKLRLSGKRLVFLADRLAEIGETRDLTIMLGTPTDALAGEQLAATHTPVPGWKRIATTLKPVAVHPWPWLRRPGTGSVTSFSAWRNGVGAPRQH